MKIRSYTAIGVVSALGVMFSPLVAASPCYVVLDHSNNVIYQSIRPPVDMSAQGAAARDAIRRRGQFMEVFESQNCVERISRAGSGNGEASVEEIVAGVKPYQGTSRTRAMNSMDADAGNFANSTSSSARVPLGY